MMSPARSQLLYNKHKGLKTKFEQENHFLNRERESYLKGYKGDIRLMERRKDIYSKRRNDIIMKRTVAESRRRSASISGEIGRTSAPPRLEQSAALGSLDDSFFITELRPRESQSASVRLIVDQNKEACRRSPELEKTPEVNKLRPITETPDLRTVSPCVSNASLSPGKPFLLRQKSVRFLPSHTCCPLKNPLSTDVPVEERIKRFLAAQADFNKTGSRLTRSAQQRIVAKNHAPRGLGVNLEKLENAFDHFCLNESNEELRKLVKYATKIKASVRNARNSSIMPRRASVLAPIEQIPRLSDV